MFSEDAYYTEFKRVRNRFRRFYYPALIREIILYTNSPSKDTLESIMRHPWLGMLLIKWITLDDHFPNRGAAIPKQSDAIELLNRMLAMESVVRMPSDYPHYTIFLRNIAYQQFPYQLGFSSASFVRQYLLFTDLPDSHRLRASFNKLNGVDIKPFLDLCLGVLPRFFDGQAQTLPNGWLSPFVRNYGINAVTLFLDRMSTDLGHLRQRLMEDDDGQRRERERYEYSVLFETPLLRTEEGFLIIHKAMLFRRIEHLVYDMLKADNASRFMDSFGPIFERYVERIIEYSGSNYQTEKTIKQLLGTDGNQIDFVIQEQKANIFVDAKAVDMTPKGMSAHRLEIILHRTKISALKAITQSYAVAAKIEANPTEQLQLAENNYLLVVTYKALHLGNGNTYYEVIAKEKIDELIAQYEGHELVPSSNIYFVTIEEFEIAAEMVRNRGFSFSQIIETAKAKDVDPQSRKFDFIQHLDSMADDLSGPDFLMSALNSVFRRLEVTLTT